MREAIPLKYYFVHSPVVDPFEIILIGLEQGTKRACLTCEHTFITCLEKSVIEHGTRMQERQVVSTVRRKCRVDTTNAGTGEKMSLDLIA